MIGDILIDTCALLSRSVVNHYKDLYFSLVHIAYVVSIMWRDSCTCWMIAIHLFSAVLYVGWRSPIFYIIYYNVVPIFPGFHHRQHLLSVGCVFLGLP